MALPKEWILALVFLILASLGAAGIFLYSQPERIESEQDTIKVGVLHSLSGTLAISERPVVDATLMAIDEINEQGGVLGRKIEPIVVDGASDWPLFAEEAERLITREKVSVIFCCWTSASRKTVKPVFEKNDHLLFYPVQYEGLEQSPNIIYTGAAPNQQVLPAVEWVFENLGRKFFIVGSDYVFPRSANLIMIGKIEQLGGEVVGEEYRVLGDVNFKTIVEMIKQTQPDVILNTVNGDSNIAFFKELRKQGITSQDVPTISFSVAEEEIAHITAELVVGDYAAWNYFQSIDTIENKRFVENFKKRYGTNRVTDDPMEAAYFGVYLWAKAVEKARTDEAREVRKALLGLEFAAPEGTVRIDPENQHVWKQVRIGQIEKDGQFRIIWSSEELVRPEPYPKYKSKAEWSVFLEDLYVGWGGRWSNPEVPK